MQALARLDCHGNFSLLITYCDLRRLHLFCLQSPDMCNEYTIVSRKYSSPFASLALVQNAGGGAYTRDATFLSRLRPPPGMKSLSVESEGQARGVTECEAERHS